MNPTALILAIAKRLIARLFTSYSYLFIAVPWLALLVVHGSDNSVRSLGEIFAILAGKPGATTFDEKDIIQAVGLIFLITNFVIELIYALTRIQQRIAFYKIETLAKLAIGICGWLVLGIFTNSLGMSVFFLIITTVLILFEFTLFWAAAVFMKHSTSK